MIDFIFACRMNVAGHGFVTYRNLLYNVKHIVTCRTWLRYYRPYMHVFFFFQIKKSFRSFDGVGVERAILWL